MKTQLVEAINDCRNEILSGGFMQDVPRIRSLLKARLSNFSRLEHVQVLLQMLTSGSLDSSRLVDLTLSHDPNFLLAFFEVPYNPEMFLEAADLVPVPIPGQVLALAPASNAVPVRITSSTDGFKAPLAVAVFGENYVGVKPEDHHRAYYFIDKFVERFRAHTLPTIFEHWSADAFPDLVAADDTLISQAAAIWVHMHEYHHRTGFLPLPRFLNLKDTRNGAGAEELRVDIVSVTTLCDSNTSDPILRCAIQFIIAERLVRYPLQASPYDNYDARSSVALSNYLVRQQALSTQGGRLFFPGGYSRLMRALRSLAVKITAVEYRLSKSPAIDQRGVLAGILPALAENGNKWSREKGLHAIRDRVLTNVNSSPARASGGAAC